MEDVSERGNLPLVKYLLALKGKRLVDTNHDYGRPLRMACRSGNVQIVECFLALGGDRRVDVHAEDEWVFRATHDNVKLNEELGWDYEYPLVMDRLLSLTNDRVMPQRLLSEYGVKDTATRGLITEWGVARERRREGRPQRPGNAVAALFRSLPREALAVVLMMRKRPW